jgi:hypothetical protein
MTTHIKKTLQNLGKNNTTWDNTKVALRKKNSPSATIQEKKVLVALEVALPPRKIFLSLKNFNF